MNKRWLQVIDRAINSAQTEFALNQSWQEIHREYALGQLANGKIKLTVHDKQQLSALVRCQTGVDLSQHRVSDFNNLHREQALAIGNNEKLAGLAAKSNRLAIKALPNQQVNINQQSYSLPPFAHLDMALENINQVQHDCILVIENYRCFDRLDGMRLQLNARFTQPLVMYRGDKEYNCSQFLQQAKLPVLAMTDIDPAGLIIAQSLPYVVALVAPELSVLESILINKDTANTTLYSKHANYHAALERSEQLTIRRFWQLLKRYQAGVVQEHWLNADVELFIHELI